MDARTDKEERRIALKILINEEELTVVALYDANTNTDCHLTELERILQDIEANNGIIVGGDFNTITIIKTTKDNIAEQRHQRND